MSSSVFPRALGVELPSAERAEGAVIFDAEGRRYLDAAGGAIVVGIGHGNSDVVDALADQARRIAYAHGTQFTTDALEDYAARVAGLLPLEGARLYLVSGGSEAVETALKLARTYHLARGEESRNVVIARWGSYHGNSLGALDASGRRSLRRPYEPWLGRALHVSAPYEYRCASERHGDGCGLELASELDALIAATGPENVACFIAEPVVGATLGAAVPPGGYWSAIEEVCRAHGVLLIADEVMTGFGRTGRWFGCEHWGLRPDIVVCGKGASSGYWPLGFAACSQEVYDAVSRSGFVHGFTHSHSVLGAAVGNAVLSVLEKESLVDASKTKGEWLKSELEEAVGGHPNVGDVRGLGLMIGVELVADRTTRAPFERSERITERVLQAAKAEGLLLYPLTGGADGIDGDAFMFGPPFVTTEAEIAEAVALTKEAIEAVLPPA